MTLCSTVQLSDSPGAFHHPPDPEIAYIMQLLLRQDGGKLETEGEVFLTSGGLDYHIFFLP